MLPHTSYLICATPRSGSSLLCEALGNTGVAGRPAEYFWRDDEPTWAGRWGLQNYTYAEYLAAALMHGTTPNGVFGAKLMWGYLDDLAAKLRGLPGFSSLDLADLLAAAYPNLRYIWMRRRDVVRQGISHWRALQTGVWGLTDDAPLPPKGEPIFDFGAIDHLVREARAHGSAWEQFFATNSIGPLTVVYEDFVDRYEQTILDVLEYLNVPVPPDLGTAKRRLRLQSDPLSEEWARRYCEHAG